MLRHNTLLDATKARQLAPVFTFFEGVEVFVMVKFMAVAIGGAVGAMMRYGVALLVIERLGGRAGTCCDLDGQSVWMPAHRVSGPFSEK